MVQIVEGSDFNEIDQIINTLKHFQWEQNVKDDEEKDIVIVKHLSFEKIIENLEHTKKFGYELRKLNVVSLGTYSSILMKIQHEIIKLESRVDNLAYNQERNEISLGIYKSLMIDILEDIKRLNDETV